MKNNQKGITLVALVITIIVLLILAGITIAALSGDNGILTNASKARQETALGEAKDMIALAVNESINAYYSETYLDENSTEMTGIAVTAGEKGTTAAKFILEAAKELSGVKVTIDGGTSAPSLSDEGDTATVRIETTDNDPIYTETTLNYEGGLQKWSASEKVNP